MCVSSWYSKQYAAFLSHTSCETKTSNTGQKARSQYVIICAIFFFKIKGITIQKQNAYNFEKKSKLW